MAAGDVVQGYSSISTGAFMTIQPGAGVEWTIHNIIHESKVELYISNGSNDMLFDADTGFGGWFWYFFHVTNSIYLKVKNTDAASKYIYYDGVQTK